MLTLDAKKFITVLHTLLGLELKIRGERGPLLDQTVKVNDAGFRVVTKLLHELDLSHTLKTAENMIFGLATIEELHRALDHVTNAFMLELEGQKFYGPLLKYAQYYEQPKLFGDAVFDSFPSANNDIFEAGTCLALERGTACVLHLMRIVEVGLRTLAQTLGVNEQNDWGSYVREIGGKLEARAKASGARSADEKFYAEALVTFDGMRMAWRNPTMHIESNYSPERAEEILIAVRSFMRHLATKLSEPIANLIA